MSSSLNPTVMPPIYPTTLFKALSLPHSLMSYWCAGFGATPTATGLFGAQTTQPQGSTLFGGGTAATKPVFGTATTSAAAASTGFGGFGTNTGTSLFGGATTQQKVRTQYRQLSVWRSNYTTEGKEPI